MADKHNSLINRIENFKNDIVTFENEKIPILKSKINTLTNEIIILNAKRERIWKLLREKLNFLNKVGDTSEIKVSYKDFKIENFSNLTNYKEDIIFLNGKLDILKKSLFNNKREFDDAWFFQTTRLRDVDAFFIAQTRQYAYLNLFFGYYKKNLELKIPHYDECIKITKLYRDIINSLEDMVEDKILPMLEISEFFLKAYEIKKIVDNDMLSPEASIEYISISSTVEELRDTNYHMFYIFIKNVFSFYIAFSDVFSNDNLTELLELNYNEVSKESIEREIYYERDTSFWSGDGLFSIDTYEERREYSVDDIKFIDYSEDINNKKNDINKIKIKLTKLDKDKEKVEKIIDKINEEN
ncbi:hypothetical protein FNCP11_12410 [Fusobacterium nucleatum]|nr:hypothetical protein FNCP11_12410 [Fusobacterium nucleatum]BEP10320.1 hypothetical protein FNSP11_11640 [Fusobacterium nucleatum]